MRFASLVAMGFHFAGTEAHSTTVGEAIAFCEGVFLDQTTWQGAAHASHCLGVTDGVARIMTLNCFSAGDGAKPEVYLSAEPPPSTKAAVRAFLNWADDNPQEWDEKFNEGVMQSMALTFPCMALGK